HKMKLMKPKKTNRPTKKGSQRDKADAYMAEFERAFNNKEKIAYVCNYDHITSKLGWHIFMLLAGGNAWKKKSEINQEGVIEGYKNITWICDEIHTLKEDDS